HHPLARELEFWIERPSNPTPAPIAAPLPALPAMPPMIAPPAAPRAAPPQGLFTALQGGQPLLNPGGGGPGGKNCATCIGVLLAQLAAIDGDIADKHAASITAKPVAKCPNRFGMRMRTIITLSSRALEGSPRLGHRSILMADRMPSI